MTKEGTLQPYARGLHNAIGFDWDAETGLMWAGETGQDNLGDDFPPDEIDLIEAGGHHGFPFFIGANRLNVGQPELERKTPSVTVAEARPPALELPAHISPIDMRLHRNGVSRRLSTRAVHRLARVGAEDERLQRCACRDEGRGDRLGIEDFATGFLTDGNVLGRPAGLTTGRDGALYVSDDNKGFIYRIAYTGR